MRSPAVAIAWELRQRHRSALLVLAVYALLFVAVRLLIPGAGEPVTLDPPNGIAGAALVPLSSAFMYFLAVFTFGLDGDMAARESPFPARMLTLPVTTRALAGWPMLFGAATMASLWLLTAAFGWWSWGLDLPLIWPALLGAVFLAWTQVLTWMPYGLPGLRIIAAVLWLATLDAVVILAVHLEIPEPRLVAILAPQLPLAYLAACFVVARTRRGEVPDWRGAFGRVFRIAPVQSSRQEGFPSATRAQVWFEWRQQGRVLPALVAILLPFELGLLYLARHEPPVLVEITLVAVLLTPPFMAGFTAAMAGRSGRDGRDSSGLTLTVTRPLTSAALVAAKLQAAFLSTLVAWLLVLVAVPLALVLSGTWTLVADGVGEIVEAFGRPRAIVIALLGVTGLLASTWKQLVQSLCIGLTGRAWIIRTSVLVRLSLLAIVGPLGTWIVTKRGGEGGVVGVLALDPRHPGRLEDVRCRLGDPTPPSKPAPERPEPGGRRRLMVGRRGRPLRCAGVARLHTAAHPALPARARRDPRRSPGTTLRRAPGPRMEPASGRASACGPGDEDDAEGPTAHHGRRRPTPRVSGGAGPGRGRVLRGPEPLDQRPRVLGRGA